MSSPTMFDPLWSALVLVLAISSFYSKSILHFLKAFNIISQPPTYTSQINAINQSHETAKALQTMINTDGAGAWPPKASHKYSWPPPLHAYHDIFLELAPLLPVDQVSLDDGVNQTRRLEYRTRLQKLLQERLDLAAVQSVLSRAEDDPSLIPADAYNGLFSCIAHLRHAFRWGTLPVVKAAQQEKTIHLPLELDVPWEFLQHRYNTKSPGGSAMSNFYCNIGQDGRPVYQVNRGLAEPIPTAETTFTYSFTEVERQALPIYYHVVQSIMSFEKGQKKRCRENLEAVNTHLRPAIKVYYDLIQDSKVPLNIFVAYIQGFHGWAAGQTVDGEFVEYDGVSGGHLVLFNLLDVFLGLETFRSEKDLLNYIPTSQVNFVTSVKKHNFREKARQAGDVEVEKELDGIVNQLRTFRGVHRKRTSRYLNAERPERMVMTSGGSTLVSGSKVQDLLDSVDADLEQKRKDTV